MARAVAPAPAAWETARGAIRLDAPRIVGILNLTPDSFSDGGRYLEPAAALDHAARLIEQGADALDLGAESTRPGRPDEVPAAEEWRRLAPVLEGAAAEFPGIPLSVDTRKADVAERALAAGAWIVNDVSGLRHDARLAAVCSAAGAGLVLMHSRGSASEMATYDHAHYLDVMEEVRQELKDAVRRAVSAGVPESRIVLDPGLGFAKRPEHNRELLDRLAELAALGRPILVGPSRKRFLAAPGESSPADRDEATAAACVAAWERGARLFRVHNVGVVKRALESAVRAAGQEGRNAAASAPAADSQPQTANRWQGRGGRA
jgi:dihydropteroate synthase